MGNRSHARTPRSPDGTIAPARAAGAPPWILAACVAAALLPVPGGAQRAPLDLSEELRVARAALASAPVQGAFDYLGRARDDAVQEWLALCNAYGPSGEEGARSRLLYKLFRIYGLEKVHVDDALNVVGVRPGAGEGPTVVLNAHHDNVRLWPAGQPIEAFVADGRVWCPAAGDDLMGVVQMLTVLRAMNAGGVRTRGDVWFVGLTGEEAPIGPDHPDASPGARHFVAAHRGRSLDWRRGDVMVQFHGGGGEGVGTGSTPVRNRSQLRIFTSFERDRWAPHAVDALGRIVTRISTEVRDPRSTRVRFETRAPATLPEDVLYLNMAMVSASEIVSRPASEAWVRFDMRADHQARLDVAHEAIERIAREVVSALGDDFDHLYQINSRNGTEDGIPGFDKLDNAPARMAAAAAEALYGVEPVIDPTNGCGDCVRAYSEGMPAFSFRGGVVDRLEGGVDVSGGGGRLRSETRRATASHDVTESAEIVRLWAGIKHGLLFVAAYSGLAG